MKIKLGLKVKKINVTLGWFNRLRPMNLKTDLKSLNFKQVAKF